MTYTWKRDRRAGLTDLAKRHLKVAFPRFKTEDYPPLTRQRVGEFRVEFGLKTSVVFYSDGRVKAEAIRRGGTYRLTWPYNLNILSREAAKWKKDMVTSKSP